MIEVDFLYTFKFVIYAVNITLCVYVCFTGLWPSSHVWYEKSQTKKHKLRPVYKSKSKGK